MLHPLQDDTAGVHASTPPLTSLYDLTREQLTSQLVNMHEPSYRVGQIWRWLYEKRVSDIDQMSDLSQELRIKLKGVYTVNRLSTVAETRSSDGWTRKWLLSTPDGAEVEAVLMEYEGIRRTACISSQAGCAMNCSFCATGQMGFLRNLRAGEIIEQVVWVSRSLADERPPRSHIAETISQDAALPDRLSHVVLMGMGEPFANYSNVLEAVRRLTEPKENGGFGLGARKITISTVGLVPGINKLAKENLQVNLAVSLHAATDELRSQLVPVNRRYPLRDLVKAVHEYINKTNRRVSYEWALIEGVNDTPEQAKELVRVVRSTFDPEIERRHMIHINMIPLNPTGGYGGTASRKTRIAGFCEILDGAGIPNTIRVRRGIDISAGCGQLKAETHHVSPSAQSM